MLRLSPNGKLTKPKRESKKAQTGAWFGLNGERPVPEKRVKKAEKPKQLFYFGKNKMRFFQNNLYICMPRALYFSVFMQ